ncbi:MAG: carbohydrate ABC transporter permease [Anaerolineales bacterium]
MNRTKQKATLDLVTYLLLIAGAVTMLGPFLWMVATSFKLPADQFTHTLIPNPATLENFRELFSFDLNFPKLFLNSTIISVLTVIGQLLTCAMAAFCFAVVKFRGRGALFTLLLITLMIPEQVSLIPNFIIFRWLHLVGTSVPLWLPAFWGGAFGTFLLRQYFLTETGAGRTGHLHLSGRLERPAASLGIHADRPQHHPDGRAGFLPDAADTGRAFHRPDGWRVAQHPATGDRILLRPKAIY